MVNLVHFVRTSNTEQTETVTGSEEPTYGVSWTDLTTAGFVAGDDVAIITAVKHWGSSNTVRNSYNVHVGTTYAGSVSLDTADDSVEPGTANSPSVQYIHLTRRTLVVDENFYGRLSMGGGTAFFNEFVQIFLKLNQLTSNDFVYNATTVGAGDAPTIETTGASVTVPMTGDWLFIAHSSWAVDDVTADMYTGIHDGTSTIANIRSQGKDTNENRAFGTMAYKAGLAATTVVSVRYFTDEAATQDIRRTSILGLRLDAFEDHAGAHTTNTITHSVLDTYQEFAMFGTYGKTSTGPFIVMGHPIHSYTETTKRPYGRIQISNADWPAANANRIAVWDTGTASLVAPFLFSYSSSQASGTLDIDLDIAEDADITPNYSCTEQVAVAFSLTLAGAPAATSLIHKPLSPGMQSLLVR